MRMGGAQKAAPRYLGLIMGLMPGLLLLCADLLSLSLSLSLCAALFLVVENASPVVVVVSALLPPHCEYLRELARVAQPPPRLHAQERCHALQLIVRQPRQVAAIFGAGLQLARWEEYAGAEHDVGEGVVGGDDALCPG